MRAPGHGGPNDATGRQTLESRIVAAGGRPSGFDYLRLGLALYVVASHAPMIAYGHAIDSVFQLGRLRPFHALVLPMFFALSGFLVSGSLVRSRSLFGFIGLRILRLAPALVAETLLAGLLIGPVFTHYPLARYFGDPMFRRYFLNLFGDVQFFLPGVFSGNPFPDVVNGQLWTLPFELLCYAALGCWTFGAAIVPALGRRWAFNILVFVLNAALLGWRVHHPLPTPDPIVGGPALIECFLYGVMFYLNRTRIVWSGWMALGCLGVAFVLMDPVRSAWGDLAAPALAAYLVVYVGLMQPRRTRIVRSGDYSYGLYLFSYPIQQAVVATFGVLGLIGLGDLAIALPLAALAAAMSWHFLERPALALRPTLLALETAWLCRIGSRLGSAVPLARRLGGDIAQGALQPALSHPDGHNER